MRRFLDTHKREDREAIRKLGKHTHFPVSSCRENVNAKKSVYNMYIYMYMYMHRVLIYSINKHWKESILAVETNTKSIVMQKISIVDYL